jgi:hypothetical protein
VAVWWLTIDVVDMLLLVFGVDFQDTVVRRYEVYCL